MTEFSILEEKTEQELVKFYCTVRDMQDQCRALNPLEIASKLEKITGKKLDREISTAYGLELYLEKEYNIKCEENTLLRD